MLTQHQYSRLPALAQAIVDFDREIIARKVEPIADIKFYRELVSRRGQLVKSAAQTWGTRVAGDGTSRS